MKRSQLWMLLVLAVVVLGSAIAVVHAKYRSRVLFGELKALDAQVDEVAIEWERLLIEHGTWGTPAHIEASARKKLKMRMPRADEVIIIKGHHGS
ncbi:MAG TPA: cell division protein FtsL [Thiolapillus brandeum]|uniref:Cell division protein FtsL n=1 Tax=Thiolapillus brandeum TaxID=1076588 RepID=A0A831WAQ5_9GAMM|nr:cell division protein FtsL [Thiolapillus brandeum]